MNEEEVRWTLANVLSLTKVNQKTLWVWRRDGRFPEPDERNGTRAVYWKDSTIKRWQDGQWVSGTKNPTVNIGAGHRKMTEADHEVIAKHLPLAQAMQKKYLSRIPFGGPEFRDEIYSAALWGLMKATLHARHGKISFDDCAAGWIWTYMSRRNNENRLGSNWSRSAKRRNDVAPTVIGHDAGISEGRIPCRRRDERELVDVADEAKSILDSLPPRERRVMEGHFIEGLTLQQVADEFGKTKQWAGWMINRATQLIRADYEARKAI